MIRTGTYSIDEILPQIAFSEIDPKGRNRVKIEFDGDLIKMNSLRLNVFKEKGISCSCCGIEGKFFAKEKHREKDPYHFNLYAIDENGEEVLMTKDHITAKSNGGSLHLDNLQTMCAPCNYEKANKV